MGKMLIDFKYTSKFGPERSIKQVTIDQVLAYSQLISKVLGLSFSNNK